MLAVHLGFFYHVYIYIFIKTDYNIETFICFKQLSFPIICWDFPKVESKVRFEWLLVIMSLLIWFWGCGCENIKDWFEFQTNDGLLGQESDFVHFWNLYKLFLLCVLCWLWIRVTVKLPPQDHCCHSTDSLLWNASYGLAMFFQFFHTLICKDKVLYFFTNKSLRCCKEKSLFVLFVLSCNNSVIILTQCFSHCTHLNKNVFIVDNICWIIFPLGFSQSPSKNIE